MVSKGALLVLLVTLAVVGASTLTTAKSTDALGGWREATRHMADVLLKGSSTVGEYIDALNAVVDATNKHSALNKSLTSQVLSLAEAGNRLKKRQLEEVCDDATSEHIEDAFIAFLTAAERNGHCPVTFATTAVDDVNGSRDLNRDFPITCRLSPFDCDNGSTLDTSAEPCTCKCKDSWQGEKCNLCNLTDERCNTGKAITREDKCECQCGDRWSGSNCETCILSKEECGHGEVSSDCTCTCNDGWGGDSCDKCEREETYCNGRGTLDKNTCECTCTETTQYLEEDLRKEIAEDGKDFFHAHKVKETLVWKGKSCDECNLDQKKHCRGFELTSGCRCNCPSNQWKGTACSICLLTEDSCKNGAKLNGDECACTIGCPKKFSTNKSESNEFEDVEGDIFCGKCTIHESECKNGAKLDKSSCQCVNEAEEKTRWGGTYYDECVLTDAHCEHNGKADKKTCECYACDEGWGGMYCDECVIDDSVCPSGKSIPNNNDCKCDCLGGWSGPHCDECHLECLHGGKLNEETCECECDAKMAWVNNPDENAKKVCNVCDTKKLDNCHSRGEINEETCQCVSCQGFSSGLRCEKCDLNEGACNGRGTLDENSCQCNCATEWDTLLCETCSIKDEECGNGATVDKERCRCSINCPEKFSNFEKDKYCKICDVEGIKEKAHGKFEEFDEETCELTCSRGRSGLFCEKCELTDAQCGPNSIANRNDCTCTCKEGWDFDDHGKCTKCNLGDVCKADASVDNETCACKCDPLRSRGRFCETCLLNKNSCFNGGVFNEDSCKCECKDGYKGVLCNECDAECETNGGRCKNGYCRCPLDKTGRNCNVPTLPVRERCRSVGDPHPGTFNGLFYNYYGQGEFIMFKNQENEKYQVNVIYEKTGSVAWTSGVAVKFRVWNEREKSYLYHTFSTYKARTSAQSGCCFDGKLIACNSASLPEEARKLLIRGPLDFDFQKGNANFNVDTKNYNTYVQARLLPDKGVSGICMGPNVNHQNRGNVPHHLFNGIRVNDRKDSLFDKACWSSLNGYYTHTMMELDELNHMSASALSTSQGELQNLDDIVSEAVKPNRGELKTSCSADPAQVESFTRLVNTLRFCSNTAHIYNIHGLGLTYCEEPEACNNGVSCKKCTTDGHQADIAFARFVCDKGMATQCPAEDAFKAIASCVADTCYGAMDRKAASQNYSVLVRECSASVKKDLGADASVSEWTDANKCVTREGVLVDKPQEKKKELEPEEPKKK